MCTVLTVHCALCMLGCSDFDFSICSMYSAARFSLIIGASHILFQGFKCSSVGFLHVAHVLTVHSASFPSVLNAMISAKLCSVIFAA